MHWLVTAIFGAMVLGGGIFGYTKARSRISLLSGIACGGLLIYAAFLIRENRYSGVLVALTVSVLLAAIFSLRWMKTKKFLPSGLLLILSLMELIVLFRFSK
ncbi:MAG TPA: TMEM14 family protein [Acidobacteriota bacterium]